MTDEFPTIRRGPGWVVMAADARDFFHRAARTGLDLADAATPRRVVVITDPPYGVRQGHENLARTEERVSGRFRRKLADVVIAGDGDLHAFDRLWHFCQAAKLGLAAFYSPFRPPPVEWKSILCWCKGEHTGASGPGNHRFKRDFEMIGVASHGPLNGKWDSGVVSVPAVKTPPSGHFCEKPLPLMRHLVRKLTDPGDVVFDPFCGSGSTGVAAVQLGRRFVGLDVDPKWAAVAANRLKQTKLVRALM